MFNKDTLTVGWVNLCFSYLLKKKNWQELAKKEYSKSDYVFKVLFNETPYPRLPSTQFEMPNGFVIGSKMTEVRAPNPIMDLSPLYIYKKQALSNAQNYLEQARESLSNRSFIKAAQLFAFAKNGFNEASIPSRRWYLHSLFAVASNRATVAYQFQMWDLLRIDYKFTLLMKLDHKRTYLRLPSISKAFGAKQLDDDFNNIVKIVQNKTLKKYRRLEKIG